MDYFSIFNYAPLFCLLCAPPSRITCLLGSGDLLADGLLELLAVVGLLELALLVLLLLAHLKYIMENSILI